MAQGEGAAVYEGAQTARIVFPLGGIGAGSIGLAGDGRLVDWEIANRPNKNSVNGFSFFAVRAEHAGSVRLARVLQGDLQPPYEGFGPAHFRGFGFGPGRETLAGLPHFPRWRFSGRFPTAAIDFEDPGAVLAVRMEAWSPFIPLEVDDSSLPCALFRFRLTNTSAVPLDVALAGNVANPFPQGAVNRIVRRRDGWALTLGQALLGADEPGAGELMLSTDSKDLSYQTYWYRGEWFDNLERFWHDFTRPGRFIDRRYEAPRSEHDVYNAGDVGLLCAHREVAPGQSVEVRMALTWHFPVYENYWNPGPGMRPRWRNAYANRFADVGAVTDYIWHEWERLETTTRQFAEALHTSTLPAPVRDAVASNLAVLKSPTVARLSDGTLYGFEGCHADAGSCEGSCTHVWNYDQATPFLFPELSRSMRAASFRFGLLAGGKMAYRLLLPLERTRGESTDRAAADGQLGQVVKALQDWRISGDTAWLRGIWPAVKEALAYAWHPANEDGWDRDRDGVMEGVQHCTLDVELYGPNAYLTGIYHAALAAAAAMAEALGEDAAVYRDLLDRGRRWVDAHLWNGEYFVQQVDLTDPRHPLDPELGELKYQIADGCHIDQVIGQWLAHVAGLGYVFDREKARAALGAIYRHNFRSMRDQANVHRIYALNDECGLVIATWPRGGRPKIPVPYSGECMNGYEYQAASHMIYEGLVEEGIRVASAVRERYDGRRRNPWNEFECGSNYARSMASYALLVALTGFEYDMTRGHLGLSPRIEAAEFRTFWCLGSGWGRYSATPDELVLETWHGSLRLSSFRSEAFAHHPPEMARVGSEALAFAFDPPTLCVRFARPVELDATHPLRLRLRAGAL